MYSESGADPFVSVVTVSLNAAAFIADVLTSVSKQARPFGLEHICVDGGSTDGTRIIVDRWAAKVDYISRIYEADTGIYDAMNKGLRAARGEYVMFLNADDFLVGPHVLESALSGLTPGSPENPDLIVGDVTMGRLDSSGLWRNRRAPRLLKRLRRCGLYPIHQGILAKRQLLNSVGGFNSGLRLAADVTLYYDLESRFALNIRYVDAAIAFMRAGGAANAGIGAMCTGTLEIYRHLRLTRGITASAAMVTVKTMQSLSEVRCGQVAQTRWFAED